ncbi:SAV_2336 N-terminal domain-related protein [Kitasatospora sp. NPDC058190]|uniref:SAV_2336 N-terminal domain-related protein n=1 Tax=Kitasatospora sp. NPDC058190 TaxID=3346371 RepID=UPI0036DF02A7
MGEIGQNGESARSVLQEALAALVAPVDGEPQPQDLADALWISRLAGLSPEPGPGARPPAAPPLPPPPTPLDPPEQNVPDSYEPRKPAPPPPAQPEPKLELHPRCTPTGGPGGMARSAEVVQVTRPTALPGALAIARALRPLRRPLGHHAGGVPQLHLDEEATAAATAEAGVLLPVWKRTRARYSVDLLIDTGATMAVWHDLAGELATLLERHGAFEEVRTWSLDTDGDVPRLAPFRRRRRAAAPPPTTGQAGPAGPPGPWARPLADPHGRRMLFVLTDGVGPAWYGDELPAFLARTAGNGPTAALQVLPRRLWHRTALRPAPVEGRAAAHGRPAPAFRSDAALPGIPRGAAGAAARAVVRWLPVMEIDADWLSPWADLTAGRASGWTPMLAAPLSGVPRPPRPRRAAGAEPRTAAERVGAFRAGSSPEAYRLACHLAAAPLSLPVMRLVQRATVPESGQRELAELFLSGLLEVRAGAVDPDEVVYDFGDGVREELLGELTRSESVRVLEHVLAKVSGRVAATFGGTLDFRALAAGAGEAGSRLPERSRPFAEVAAAVLAGAGGQHAAIARTLGGTVSRSESRRELLTPVPPIVSPPDPPRMIGRAVELEQLTLELRQTGYSYPKLVVIEASPGMGRRRLVQEYVQRYGPRHSFVHWIDGRTSGSLQAGLDRLRALPLSKLGHDHPNWVVIVDGLRSRSDLRTQGSLQRFFGLAYSGPGSLIITTDSASELAFPRDAPVIALGYLSEADLREEIRARLGDDYARIEESEELQQLIDRMPRIPDELASWNLDAKLAMLTASAREGASDTVRSFPLPCRAVAMAAVPNSDGESRLAVLGVDNRVYLVDPTNGQEITPPLDVDVPSDVVAMAAFGDWNVRASLFTAHADGGLETRVFTVDGRSTHYRELPLPPEAMATHTHTDGRQYVLIVDALGRMQLWDPQLEAPAHDLPGVGPGTMTSVRHADGPSFLLGVDPDGSIRRWSTDSAGSGIRTGERIDPARVKTIVGLAGDENRTVVATIGERDDHVHVWELSGCRIQPPPPADPTLRFTLLGEVGAWRGDEPVGIGAPAQAAVLAVLLKRCGRPVSEGDLLRESKAEDEFFIQNFNWLRGCVRRLRDALNAAPAAPDVLESLDLDEAYVLNVDVDQIDVTLFERALERAESARSAGDPSAVRQHVDEALALWKGTPLPGLPGLSATGERTRLNGLYERAQELRREVVQTVNPPSAPDRNGLRFSLLGPLRVWRDGELLDLGVPQQRAVLGTLLLHSPGPVSTASLVNAVWGDQPPPQPLAELRTYVSRIRTVLGDRSEPRGAAVTLQSASDGFQLLVAPEAVDLSVFEARLAEAQAAEAAGDLRLAHDVRRAALSLWEGPLLESIPGAYISWERTRLAERRLTVFEDMYTAALGLGRHEEIVYELSPLVAEHPTRERLVALLMLALHRCRRRTEALNAYEQLQELLFDDVAVEPSPVLRVLRQRIQADDPELQQPGGVEGSLLAPGKPIAPSLVDARELPPGSAHPEQGLAIGLDANELSTVFVDFDRNPLFVAFGDSESGKTALLRLLVKQITERYGPDQVGILVGDLRRSLFDVVPADYLVHYAPSTSSLATLVGILRVACFSRMRDNPEAAPRRRRDKDIFLIVDEYELAAADEDLLQPLVEYLPLARQLGLRVIVARRTAGAGRARSVGSFLRTLCDLGPHGVVLSGDVDEGLLLGTVEPQPRAPGRGMYVTPGRTYGRPIQIGWLPRS